MAPTSKPSAQRETTFTLRDSPYTYVHLRVHSLTSSSMSHHKQSLDEITALTYLNSALQQFLGITGTAISIDILKVENQDVWMRVPREDGSAVVAAVSQWTGRGKGVSLKIMAKGSWLGGLVANAEKGSLWSLGG